MGKKLFDYVIGNPPYQEEQISDNTDGSLKNYAPPVYHLFMEASYSVSNKVELITPARFLFNAGSTPKGWNKKMLSDKHFKIITYEQASNKIFPDTYITGGLAITIRDTEKEYGEIGAFTPYPLLNAINQKVLNRPDFKSFSEIIFSRTAYRLTQKMHDDYPEAIKMLSNGHPFDMASNIFDRLPFLFYDDKPNDKQEYVQIHGRQNNNRVFKWIRADYVNNPKDLSKWKVFVPQANGAGAIGEVISTLVCGQPFYVEPLCGHTETYLSIGYFDTETESKACYKYVCSKFARTLLGVLKITQNNPPETWKYVPLQDFTENSDIDWSKSVAEIDRQLYRKYNLSPEEIDFIETHVKEMA